ncbi:hypothetical protein B398_10060 [Xylella fastidiosa 32]|nr:hypothetical protein B398_10060 [Xylella fastidiosa 32]
MLFHNEILLYLSFNSLRQARYNQGNVTHDVRHSGWLIYSYFLVESWHVEALPKFL